MTDFPDLSGLQRSTAMTCPDFYEIYPTAADLYIRSGFEIESVRAVYGQRSDWPAIRKMLVGTDG